MTIPKRTVDKKKTPKQRHTPSIVGTHHGALSLESLQIAGYNLEVRDGAGFAGDRASQSAFRAMLDDWRQRHRAHDRPDPFGRKPSRKLSKKRLDQALADEPSGVAGDLVRGAIEDFALELTGVIQRFMRQKSWRGVQRIVVGGGFPESEVGERAILQAAALCDVQELPVQLGRISHHSDDAGLIGWVHLAPRHFLENHDALLALDIGGTNVRCGVVRLRRDKADDLSRADVVWRDKWRHADHQPSRTALVDHLARMLCKGVAYCERKGLRLAPFVGIACPGLIRDDGSIARGTQNLPGDWQSDRFHLPTALRERLPVIAGAPVQILMHNDAVVQGLSERPFMQDVKRWAVLTIGTGLGNASYVNAPRRRGKPA